MHLSVSGITRLKYYLCCRVVLLGGDGTVCQVLNAIVMQQQGNNVKELKPLNVTIGVIPTGKDNKIFTLSVFPATLNIRNILKTIL